VLFAVDDLIDYIIEKIEECFLLPKCIIDIWLLAQELGLTLLQNICFAVCLDRFAELPCKSLNKLSTFNFSNLIINVHLRCELIKLIEIIQNWVASNNVTVMVMILITLFAYIHYNDMHSICIFFYIKLLHYKQ